MIKSQVVTSSIVNFTFGTFQQEGNGTSLALVGMQLWSASFLLGDFMYYLRDICNDQVALEIGSGIGFIAVLCAKLGFKRVYATDVNVIMESLSRNIHRNNVGDIVKVCPLDMYCHDHPLWTNSHSNSLTGSIFGPYSEWGLEDVEEINNSRFVFASDIIYDDDLTWVFVLRLPELLKGEKALYLSLEKRIVFTISDGICAPAYDFFFESIKIINARLDNQICAELIDTTSLPINFGYKRTEELELWKIYISNNEKSLFSQVRQDPSWRSKRISKNQS